MVNAAGYSQFSGGSYPPVISRKQNYDIPAGMTLKQGMVQWSAETGCDIRGMEHWEIIWETHVDYPVDAPLIFQGDYLSSVTKIINLYSAAQIPLYAHIHQSQCLVVIDTR
ncbi:MULTISPECIES: toxin co-regulated pilus biosynthesis Q family protein [unclassified Tatumella]|uniref:toxin co-regulated pilus biosynthesis Q family protein n=1 Tax=unclassified Tatumella TaxID=2649542 RepID=UPI0024B1974F|nr:MULTISPECIES: toxin co-regulated pilus biosynthesis Q family protein [unclassified Tatumella]